MVTLFSDKFPREVGKKRKLVHDKEEYFEWVNQNNGYQDCYTSLYSFNEHNDWKPDYYSAEVTKAFFDLDIGKDEDFAYETRQEGLEALREFHQFLKEKNLKHAMFISGGGIHVYVFTKYNVLKYKKDALTNLQHYILEQLDNVKTDPSVIGDLAQITRIPNTYNIGAEKFCIPITSEEVMNMNPDELWALAEQQRPTINPIVKGKLINLEKFDQQSQKTKRILDGDFEEFDDEINTSTNINIEALNPPPSIRYILNKYPDGHLNYEKRFLLILFFRDAGLTEEETSDVLRDILSDDRYYHCTQEECGTRKYGQISYLFDKEDQYRFPNPKQIQEQYGIPVPDERPPETELYYGYEEKS